MRDIVSRLQQGLHTARERGEELAQAARMRVEVFTLGREQEALYARLGRAYHDGASPEVLEGIQVELRRVSEEIAARERVLGELTPDPAEELSRPPAVLPPESSGVPQTPPDPRSGAQIPGAQIPSSQSPGSQIPGAQPIAESPQGDPHGPTDGSGSWPSPSEFGSSGSGSGAAEDRPRVPGAEGDPDPEASASSAADLWRKP